jgi:hypothetical protein
MAAKPNLILSLIVATAVTVKTQLQAIEYLKEALFK